MTERLDWWVDEFPDKWWLTKEWIKIKGEAEPPGMMLLMNYMLENAIITPAAVKIASLIPRRLMFIEIYHPVKDTVEKVGFQISPMSVVMDAPDEEPDLVFRMNYYDLVRFLDGQQNFSLAAFLGRAEVYGNLVGLFDIGDVLEVAQGKEINSAKAERTSFWPLGIP